MLKLLQEKKSLLEEVESEREAKDRGSSLFLAFDTFSVPANAYLVLVSQLSPRSPTSFELLLRRLEDRISSTSRRCRSFTRLTARSNFFSDSILLEIKLTVFAVLPSKGFRAREVRRGLFVVLENER